MIQPQEIMVWYVLPAIRSKVAATLKAEHKLSQKDIAHTLRLTEAAVSQYLKGKRASEVKFTPKLEKQIKESSKAIFKDKSKVREEIQKVCRMVIKERILCKIHRKHEPDLGPCNVCFID